MAKQKGDSDTKKSLGLFDHIQQITNVQNPNYWETLTDADKKTFSNYMILRFLSMKYDWMPLIAELQPVLQNLPPKQMYLTLIDLLPKGREFLKYINGKKSTKYPDWLVDCFKSKFDCSKKEAVEYIEILHSIENGHSEIKKIAEAFGTDSKEIKKLKLKV